MFGGGGFDVVCGLRSGAGGWRLWWFWISGFTIYCACFALGCVTLVGLTGMRVVVVWSRWASEVSVVIILV